MARKRYSSEQIIRMLREAEVLLNKGSSVIEVSRKLGIAEQTYYRWRKDYGGMRVDQAKRLKELDLENQNILLAGEEEQLAYDPHCPVYLS